MYISIWNIANTCLILGREKKYVYNLCCNTNYAEKQRRERILFVIWDIYIQYMYKIYIGAHMHARIVSYLNFTRPKRTPLFIRMQENS